MVGSNSWRIGREFYMCFTVGTCRVEEGSTVVCGAAAGAAVVRTRRTRVAPSVGTPRRGEEGVTGGAVRATLEEGAGGRGGVGARRMETNHAVLRHWSSVTAAAAAVKVMAVNVVVVVAEAGIDSGR